MNWWDVLKGYGNSVRGKFVRNNAKHNFNQFIFENSEDSRIPYDNPSKTGSYPQLHFIERATQDQHQSEPHKVQIPTEATRNFNRLYEVLDNRLQEVSDDASEDEGRNRTDVDWVEEKEWKAKKQRIFRSAGQSKKQQKQAQVKWERIKHENNLPTHW